MELLNKNFHFEFLLGTFWNNPQTKHIDDDAFIRQPNKFESLIKRMNTETQNTIMKIRRRHIPKFPKTSFSFHPSNIKTMTIKTPLILIYSYLLHHAHFAPAPPIGFVQAVGLREPFSVHKILQLESKTRNKNEINKETLANTGAKETAIDLHGVEELYIEQRLDHFHQNKRTFSQRYFHSSKYVFSDVPSSSDVEANAKKLKNQFMHDDAHKQEHLDAREFLRGGGSSNNKSHVHEEIDSTATTIAANTKTSTSTGLVYAKDKKPKQIFAFLCVGGEGPSLTKNVLIDSVHCSGDMLELASKMKSSEKEETEIEIHLFALEHRYYGNSYPQFDEGSPVSNENLQYLSSRQAIADIANFIEFANTKYGLIKNDNVKWITFGGSYPGMLAAWSRYKFPHLIHGAVSNSAPVQVKFDFQEYNNVVGNALKNPAVGGSDKCYDIVKNGHDEIVSILDKDTKEGREHVATLFNLCGGEESLTKQKNVNGFLGDGVVFIPAQANDPSCEKEFCNIEKVRLVCHQAKERFYMPALSHHLYTHTDL